jgi:hypothetical protein
MLVREDVEAYMSVLGYPTPGSRQQNVMGCLVRVEQQMLPLTYGNVTWRAAYDMLKFRERLNGYLAYDHPLLVSITRQLSNILSSWLENPNAFK